MAEYIPTDLVQKLGIEGKSENEIKTILIDRGFSESQINTAMKSAIKDKIVEVPKNRHVSRPHVGGHPTDPGVERHPGRKHAPTKRRPEEIRPEQIPEDLRPVTLPNEIPTQKEFPKEIERPKTPIKIGKPLEYITPPAGLKPMEVGEGVTKSEIGLEELVEEIVAEKWKDLENKFEKVENRDESLHKSIEKLKDDIKGAHSLVDEREASLTVKIETLEKLVEPLDPRISALEKAFKELANSIKK